ncbi:MAG: hypothetical protein B7Z26_08590, partial [Asticcacaulis sp. 32-58-5]
MPSDIGEKLKSCFQSALALQRGRFFLWLPVALGTGCAAYLYLKFEPSWWMIWALTGATALFFGWLGRINITGYVTNFVLVFLLFCMGIVLCKARAENVSAPVIDSAQSQYSVSAYVVDVVSTNSEAPRVLLAPIRIDGVAARDTPVR